MRVALNGYGRIGRSFVRALAEREAGGWQAPFSLVAINDLGRPEDLLYLTRFDSTHGPFPGLAALGADGLTVGRHTARLFSNEDPAGLPWQDMGIGLALECTGVFRGHDEASEHLRAGAQRVIIGAVPFDQADALLVYGVNHETLQPGQRVLSAASCTTHAIAPLLAALDQAWGVEQVLMKEVHAYTSDQTLLDHVHRDPRRGRAAAQNIVPTTSSAIGAVQQILPQLAGRISGGSIRVPTLNVAMVDLTLRLRQVPTASEVNGLMARRADEVPWLIGYNNDPLVSVDFNHRSESAIFDATQTRVQGDMVRVVAWYDNEWGYANRLLDLVSWLARHP
ncbi:type I glyceraldehyde-3-phosphate dehydrogenase [Isoalcanivorax indicus]|uniref:type I glyceraldehyde-3-phosphate dehydrogenase n=1 Tax=Isoalcanivorax indicus TaxID=2202653 RepID=UPI000DB91151|nr:type I glyceraldehyde-3-phosphate dehydrogenase [Isoalcanivorax indicus]